MDTGNRHSRRRRRPLLRAVVAMAVAGGGLTVGAGPAQANFFDVAYACGYYSNVSLFNGPYGSMGCGTQSSPYADANSASPSVKDDWSNTPLSAIDQDGAAAIYDVANMFTSPYLAPYDTLDNSGALEVATWTSPGNSALNARAKAYGVGPSPFWTQTPQASEPYAQPAKSETGSGGTNPYDGSAGYVEATCGASSVLGKWGSTTIKNGRVDTKTIVSGQSKGYPAETVIVPENPPRDYRINFTMDHMPGESGYIVFNEHVYHLDGSLTINGSHMYMNGPRAKGDVVIAQVQCGRTA